MNWEGTVRADLIDESGGIEVDWHLSQPRRVG